MSANSVAPGAQQKRFAAYLDRLAQAAGHLDRVVPLKSYCTGLLLPGERKSVEPMAARLCPGKVRQTHQSSRFRVKLNVPWCDVDVHPCLFTINACRSDRRSPTRRKRDRNARYNVRGISADVSGASLTPFGFSVLGVSASTYQHLNNYLFGPTVTANLGRSSVFAHALFGEARSSLGAGVSLPIIGGISTGLTSANALAMAFGGGVDIGLTRHLGIRAVQVDYLRTQFNATDALTTGLSSSLGNRQNSFRFSTGVVFRF